MPYQETPTLLPIASWAKILGMNPLHVQQIDVTSAFSSEAICGSPTMQYAWQNNARTGRETVAQAIATAEALIKDRLGYAVLPEWVSEEVILHDQDWRPEMFPWPVQAVRGMARSVMLSGGMFVGGGQRTVSVIQAGAAIAYTDTDGDGYAETATVTVATSITDANQIAVYYPAANTPEVTAADDAWEIRPLTVSISGGIATIRFRRELAAKFALLLALEPQSIDGLNNANFLATVDVYQRYTNPSTSFRAEWEPSGWDGMGCGCSGVVSCPSCGYSVQTGCLLAHDDRNAIVRMAPATYTADTGVWTPVGWATRRAPDRVTAWYRAGYRDKGRARPYYDMDRTFAQAVALLSVTLLERPVCGCDQVATAWESWRLDVAQNLQNASGGMSWQISQSDLACPFGTRRGALMAWHLIEQRLLGRAAVA